MTRSRFLTPVLVIAAVLLLLAMMRLGVWQLDRAEQKQQISDAVLAMSQTRLVLSGQETVVSANQRYAQASADGEYMGDQSFLLDGQVVNGQVGYSVITPFKISDSDLIVLVNRGWVSVGSSRDVKPDIITPKGKISISGRLNLPPSKPVFFDEDIPVVQKGAWQFLEFADYTRRTGVDVLPLLIELDKTLDQVGGYVRQWRSYDDDWVDRHKAYAFQWFSMSFAFLILCVYVWRKSKSVTRV